MVDGVGENRFSDSYHRGHRTNARKSMNDDGSNIYDALAGAVPPPYRTYSSKQTREGSLLCHPFFCHCCYSNGRVHKFIMYMAACVIIKWYVLKAFKVRKGGLVVGGLGEGAYKIYCFVGTKSHFNTNSSPFVGVLAGCTITSRLGGACGALG